VARFLGIRGDARRIGRASGERSKRQPYLERLESRVVLDGGLTPGLSTPVAATAGTLVSGAPLVTFTDGASPLPANDYSATIDWGDGTPQSGGTLSVSGTTFTVEGSHNFAQPSSAQSGGVDTVTVQIVGDGQQVSTTTTATVGGLTYANLETGLGTSPGPGRVTLPLEEAPLQAVPGSPTPGIGFSAFDAEPTADPTAYTATVDWGDGSTPTVATIEAAGSGALVADTSGHTYALAGNYTVQIAVRDAQGFVVGTGSEPIFVYNPTATPASSLTATAGAPTGSLTVATLTATPNYNFQGSNYTAVVDWGDGSPPVEATITTVNADALDVTTSGHTYAQEGTYAMTLTVRDAQGVVVDMVHPTIAVNGTLSGWISPPSVTIGPVINSATFNRRTATAVITYQDDVSGIELAGISNSTFYHLSAEPLSKRVRGRRLMLPTSISVTPAASQATQEVVKIIFNHGRPLRGGRYLLTVQGTVESDAGIANRIDFAQFVR
jgi:hypothetical protein